MKIIQGNLITLAEDGVFDVIIHGCNCFCTMGSGIAKEIKKRYPQAYQADLATVKGDVNKLGTYSQAFSDDNDFRIINAYTQYNYGTGKRHADYTAIAIVFGSLKRELPKNSKIGYPKIGCGLAGGDWRVVRDIIDFHLEGLDHTLVEYNGDK